MEDLMTYVDEDGNVRLLPGYKFDPTDEVLVDFYLKRRVFPQPLPFQIIPDFDVFQTEPCCLPGDGKIFNERKCFFYNTMGHDLENFGIRVAGSGQWRIVEKDKDVPIPLQNNQVIGKRNTLIFWKVQGACFLRTKWVMHEFRLALMVNPSKMANWAVYRIFQNEDAKKVKNARGSNEESSNVGNVEVIDFNAESGSFSEPPLMIDSLSERSEYP